MAESVRPAEIKDYFLKINRWMTSALMLLLIIVSLIFWVTKSVTLENSSLWIGAALMLLAVVFYQLPFISYLLTRAYFKQQEQTDSALLNCGWRQFKARLDL